MDDYTPINKRATAADMALKVSNALYDHSFYMGEECNYKMSRTLIADVVEHMIGGRAIDGGAFKSLAVWIMNQETDGDRHYYIDNEQRIDYHQQRIQDPAEALIDEQESILAGMDRIRDLSKRILGNDDSNSNDEGSE